MLACRCARAASRALLSRRARGIPQARTLSSLSPLSSSVPSFPCQRAAAAAAGGLCARTRLLPHGRGCCRGLVTASTAVSTSLEVDDPQLDKDIQQFSGFLPQHLSLKQYAVFGQRTDRDRARLESARFVQNEVRIRLAHMIRELQASADLVSHRSMSECISSYVESFRAFNSITPATEASSQEEQAAYAQQVTDTIVACRRRHESIPLNMARGVLELRNEGLLADKMQALNEFMDRFHMYRIGMRFLNNQHLSLFSEKQRSGIIGNISSNCNVREVVSDAANAACHLCDEMYFHHPPVEIITPGGEEVTFTYAPSHLYHIVFELLKNSFRAVCEHHESADELPPVKVITMKGENDITVKISDEGGGISREQMSHLFSYLYSTAPTPSYLDAQNHPSSSATPMAGFGYGLPLSRLYARYFGGDLCVISMEGFGTDAFVYLRAVPDDAEEVIPSFRPRELSTYLSNQGQWMADEVHWLSGTSADVR